MEGPEVAQEEAPQSASAELEGQKVLNGEPYGTRRTVFKRDSDAAQSMTMGMGEG